LELNVIQGLLSAAKPKPPALISNNHLEYINKNKHNNN